MTAPPQEQLRGQPVAAWVTAVLAGVAAPALAMLGIAGPQGFAAVGSSLLALGLMGTGMIAAAAAGRLRVGVLLAMPVGAGLLLLARLLGMPGPAHPLWTGLAVILASLSFAARGTLFARSGGRKGWLIAVLVVAGEAAMLLTAAAKPGAMPDWLLALLPAQWASIALRTALAAGTGQGIAIAALLALGGTAAATLLVVRLWPRRWPYLVMFTTWLALSALVWHWPPPLGTPLQADGLPPGHGQMAQIPLTPGNHQLRYLQ
jgi:hypothetical protein